MPSEAAKASPLEQHKCRRCSLYPRARESLENPLDVFCNWKTDFRY